MTSSEKTKARLALLGKLAVVALFVPIALAAQCPLTIDVACTDADVPGGTDFTFTPNISGGTGDVTITATASDGSIVVNDDGTVTWTTPNGGGEVTVTITATDSAEPPSTVMGTCPVTVTPGACETNDDCDDGDDCNGAETCDLTTDPDNPVCVDGTPVDCDDGFTCDPNDGTCDCDDDASCDDGDLCNGDETCGDDGDCDAGTPVSCPDDGLFCTGVEGCTMATGVCGSTGDPCTAPDVCNEATDICAPACDSAADCDDSDACTDDACDSGSCVFTDVDCDDGEFCTGVETCDSDTGCVAGPGDPCAADEFCDEVDDECDPEQACTVTADCDDGLFCNGSETCGADLFCDAGTVPCATDQTCNETTDMCTGGTAQMFRLTFTTDTFAGASGGDTFNGAIDIVGGVIVQTLNNSDSLTGALGKDTLTAQLRGGGTTSPALLSGIECINLEVSDAMDTTVGLATWTGGTTLNNVASGANLTANSIPSVLTNIGYSNSAQDFIASFGTNVLNGAADALTLTLAQSTDGGAEPVITIQPPAAGSGYETVNIVSSGAIINGVDQITDGNGNSWTTLNISGSQGLTLDDQLDATITTVGASTATGALDLTLPATNTAVTTGSGNDTLRAAGVYTSSDTINTGTGTDILELNSADAAVASTQTNVTGVETVQIANALANDLTISRFGATVINLVGGTGGAQTLTVPAGGTVDISTLATAHNLTVNPSTDGTADALTLNLKGVNHGGNLTASNIETLNIAASVGAAVITGNIAISNTAASEIINVTGGTNLSLGDAAADTIQADQINAGTFTGVLTVNGTAQSAIQITGGTGNDVLFGGAGADILVGGDGNDSLNGGSGGADSLTGGNGADTHRFDNSAAIDTVVGWVDGSDLVEISSAAGDFDGGTGLAAGAGAAASLGAQAAGTMTLKDVAQNAAASAVGAAHFIKLTTGVASAATDQLTFNAAIGTATVTGLTASTGMAGSFYDTTNSRMVLFEVAADATTTTIIETGDAILVIARIGMSATDYTNFTTSDILSSDF